MKFPLTQYCQFALTQYCQFALTQYCQFALTQYCQSTPIAVPVACTVVVQQKVHNGGCSLTQTKLLDGLSLNPNKLHKIFIKYINTPTNSLWCYGCKCIVQWSPACFGHSSCHLQGGENKNTNIIMCLNDSTDYNHTDYNHTVFA